MHAEITALSLLLQDKWPPKVFWRCEAPIKCDSGHCWDASCMTLLSATWIGFLFKCGGPNATTPTNGHQISSGRQLCRKREFLNRPVLIDSDTVPSLSDPSLIDSEARQCGQSRWRMQRVICKRGRSVCIRIRIRIRRRRYGEARRCIRIQIRSFSPFFMSARNVKAHRRVRVLSNFDHSRREVIQAPKFE